MCGEGTQGPPTHHGGGAALSRVSPGSARLCRRGPRARPIRHRLLPAPARPPPPVRGRARGRTEGRGSAGGGQSQAGRWGGGGEPWLGRGRGCAVLFHHPPSCHGRWWPFAFVGIYPVGKIQFTVGPLWEQTVSLNLLDSTWVWSMAQHSFL